MTFVKECAWSDTARRVISLHFPILFFAHFVTKLCRIVQSHALKGLTPICAIFSKREEKIISVAHSRRLCAKNSRLLMVGELAEPASRSMT